MISEIKSASDHSMALLMGDKENILKSILRQLFEGIYREIEGKCNFTEENREHINEFLAWPDDYDLTDTAFFFNRRLFGHQIFDRVRNGKQFSLGELDTIIQHPKSKIKQVDKRRLNDRLEIKKNFKFSIRKMREVGAICDELIRIRNLAAHNAGLKNSAQALILMSNILRLLAMTPDAVKDSTQNFSYLEEFMKHEFLDSILRKIRPDIDEEVEELKQKIEAKGEKSEDILNAMLLKKIDEVSSQLKEVKDMHINNTLSDNQVPINQILSLIKESKNAAALIKESKNKPQRVEQIDEILDLHNLPYKEEVNKTASIEDLSRSEVFDNLMELRVIIKKEMNLKFLGFRKSHNLLDEPLANAMLDERLDTLKKLKASPTFQMQLKFNKMSHKGLFPTHANKDPKKNYMDIEIKDYWLKIQLILEDFFKDS